MQKFLLVLLISLPSFLFAQTLPVNLETKKVEYTGIIEVNASKENLFWWAKNWISRTFNSPDELIQVRDEEYLAIEGLAMIDYIPLNQPPSAFVEIPMHFTLALDFTDNKYRYTFSNIYFGKGNESDFLVPFEETSLSKKEQELLISERLKNLSLSESDFKEELETALDQYSQFKAKGDGAILGILELLKSGIVHPNAQQLNGPLE